MKAAVASVLNKATYHCKWSTKMLTEPPNAA
jgi:hypothetical protein